MPFKAFRDTPKSRALKAKNKAQTLPKQLQNNFEKVQNTTFSTPHVCKTRVPIWQECRWIHFRYTTSKIPPFKPKLHRFFFISLLEIQLLKNIKNTRADNRKLIKFEQTDNAKN